MAKKAKQKQKEIRIIRSSVLKKYDSFSLFDKAQEIFKRKKLDNIERFLVHWINAGVTRTIIYDSAKRNMLGNIIGSLDYDFASEECQSMIKLSVKDDLVSTVLTYPAAYRVIKEKYESLGCKVV